MTKDKERNHRHHKAARTLGLAEQPLEIKSNLRHRLQKPASLAATGSTMSRWVCSLEKAKSQPGHLPWIRRPLIEKRVACRARPTDVYSLDDWKKIPVALYLTFMTGLCSVPGASEPRNRSASSDADAKTIIRQAVCRRERFLCFRTISAEFPRGTKDTTSEQL